MPHNRDPLDVAFELHARGYANSATEARHMVINEPHVVRALLRFHDVPEMRHVDDVAIGWGPLGIGTDPEPEPEPTA